MWLLHNTCLVRKCISAYFDDFVSFFNFIYIHLFLIHINFNLNLGMNETAILEKTTVSFHSEQKVIFMVKKSPEQLMCIAYQQLVYF